MALSLFFAYVLVAENALVALWAWSVQGATAVDGALPLSFSGVYSAALLCSAAASFIGGLFGFLFGVPRSKSEEKTTVAATKADLQKGKDPGGVEAHQEKVTATRSVSPHSHLRQNTNLENISDGLTKGLLGIGLSQLYQVPTMLQAAAETLGPVFGPGASGKVVGISVVLYGGVGGFIFGYLLTRVYLTGLFDENDPK